MGACGEDPQARRARHQVTLVRAPSVGVIAHASDFSHDGSATLLGRLQTPLHVISHAILLHTSILST